MTAARDEWRKQLRCKALQVHKAVGENDSARLGELHLEMTLLLNPLCKEDHRILTLIRGLPTLSDARDRQTALNEFSARLALLLKLDWERTKLEADSPLSGLAEVVTYFLRRPWRTQGRGDCDWKPQRISYEEWQKQVEREHADKE